MKDRNDLVRNDWHLQAPGPYLGINAAGLSEEGHAEIKVVIVDTGIDYTHPALRHAIDPADARDFDSTVDPSGRDLLSGRLRNDYDAHGTALAGIIAARTDDPAARDIRGIAPGCTIVPVRISSNFEPGSIAAALRHAAEVGDVLLLARTLPESLKPVVEEVAKVIPVVCASGNNGRGGALAFPASAEGTIAVGACNEKGWRSTYSQHGPALDVVAPSNDVSVDTRSLLRRSREEVERRAEAKAAEADRRRRPLLFQEKKETIERLVQEARQPAQQSPTAAMTAHSLQEYPEPFAEKTSVAHLQEAAAEVEPPFIAHLIQENASELLGRHPAKMAERIAREWTKLELRQSRGRGHSQSQDGNPAVDNSDRLGVLAIATTDNAGTSGYNVNPTGDYCFAERGYTFGGTSAAAAQVAGVVALMLSAALRVLGASGSQGAVEDAKEELRAKLRPDKIRNLLRASASKDKLHSETDRETGATLTNEFGDGLVDASEAVEAARAAV